ncbi:hypothetical protein MHYP_G00040340 [Metynnis hypsauchen]
MSASSRGAIATSLTSQTNVLARTWSGRAYGSERRGSPRGSDGGGVTSLRRLKVNNEKRCAGDPRLLSPRRVVSLRAEEDPALTPSVRRAAAGGFAPPPPAPG